MSTVVLANLDPQHPPRNKAEATEQLGAVRERDPDNAPRYRLRFTAGGWNVVRVDP